MEKPDNFPVGEVSQPGTQRYTAVRQREVLLRVAWVLMASSAAGITPLADLARKVVTDHRCFCPPRNFAGRRPRSPRLATASSFRADPRHARSPPGCRSACEAH